jgi:hypothetical protein
VAGGRMFASQALHLAKRAVTLRARSFIDEAVSPKQATTGAQWPPQKGETSTVPRNRQRFHVPKFLESRRGGAERAESRGADNPHQSSFTPQTPDGHSVDRGCLTRIGTSGGSAPRGEFSSGTQRQPLHSPSLPPVAQLPTPTRQHAMAPGLLVDPSDRRTRPWKLPQCGEQASVWPRYGQPFRESHPDCDLAGFLSPVGMMPVSSEIRFNTRPTSPVVIRFIH